MPNSRDRLVEAAFALFDERGFEGTTVDDVAERAGVGRSTFFRAFGSKEDVIFPDHAEVLRAMRDRLATATGTTYLVAVTEAARIVLLHYLAEGDRARIRYRLTRTVPALRAREIASQQQYQQTFREFLRGWLGEEPGSDLRAELVAGAVVTAHNHVLRRWLRGELEAAEAEREFDTAMALATGLVGRGTAYDDGAALAARRALASLEEALPALRRAVDGAGGA